MNTINRYLAETREDSVCGEQNIIAIDNNQLTHNNKHALLSGFNLNKNGVYYHGEEQPQWICSYLEIVALVRDKASENWGRLLEFHDADGKVHQWSMPMEMLKGSGDDLRGELLRMGLLISPNNRARNRLIEYITTAKPSSRARCVNRIGWHDDVFVLPDISIGQTNEKIIYQTEHATNNYQQLGTLEDWRNNIAALCIGNSRLIFALSTAFASILLYPAQAESGGIHFVGESSSGKTTALRAAASVYGNKDYLQRWRATANGLESLAALHSDTLLILDELSQVDAIEAGEIAYMLANGSGKTRANKNGHAKARQNWRVLFLSAGEIGLAQHMLEVGKKAKAGQAIRLVDIPAVTKFGIFENLHGYETGAELARAINEATEKYYGTAAFHFLQTITQSENYKILGETIKGLIQQFKNKNLSKDSSGQAARVCERFALISAAGELASKFDITGWPCGEAELAASNCYQAWFEQVGGAHNQERNQILTQVRAFFEAHGSSRFELLESKNEQKIHNRVGFKKVEHEQTIYYVLPETFKREICEGYDWRIVSKLLIEVGWLSSDCDGKATHSVRLPGMSRTRCYVFTSDLWEYVE